MILRILLASLILVSAVQARAASPDSWAARRLASGLAAYDARRFTEARRAFQDLAEHNSAIAETMLGVMYAKGRGVKPDLATAFAYYYRAANRGYPAAQLAASDAFAEGKGTPRDAGQAYFWARLAALHGDPRLSRAAQARAARLAAGFSTAELRLFHRDLRRWRPWVEMAR